MNAVSHESGQTMIEFGIFCTVILMLTVGLVDVGRGFFQYNEVATLARYGARWGSVVGGECTIYGLQKTTTGTSVSDWCNSFGSFNNSTNSGNFWQQYGTVPLQSTGASCPSSLDTTKSYQASDSRFSTSGADSQSIVGAIVHKLDTDSKSQNKFTGTLAPGIDFRNLYVCIALPSSWNSSDSLYEPGIGDKVSVYVYYPFTPVGPLLGKNTLNLFAESEYVIE